MPHGEQTRSRHIPIDAHGASTEVNAILALLEKTIAQKRAGKL